MITLNNDVHVKVELEDNVLLDLCLIAHRRDITLNQLANQVLREFLDRESIFSDHISSIQIDNPYFHSGEYYQELAKEYDFYTGSLFPENDCSSEYGEGITISTKATASSNTVL
jgi:hypothetical protein